MEVVDLVQTSELVDLEAAVVVALELEVSNPVDLEVVVLEVVTSKEVDLD